MADPWDAFPDAAPAGGLVINMTRKPPNSAGVDPWDAFPDAKGAAPNGAGRTVSRLGGQFAQGANDAIAGTIGAPVDAAAWALRKAGVPVTAPIGGSESIKKGIDYVATLPGRVGDAVSQGSLSPLADDRTSRFEPETGAEKFAHGAGEGVINALSIAVPAAAVARGARAGSVVEGVANTLASQPTAQAVAGAAGAGTGEATENRAFGVAASLAAPVGIGAVRRGITPVRNALSAQEARLVGAANDEGIPLTAAQRTGSPALTQIEGSLAKIPGASGPMQRTFNEQRGQFNRAVLERAGVTATDASPETMTRAFTNAGQTFDDLGRRTTLNIDNGFVNDVNRVAHNYGRRLDTNIAPIFNSYMDDLAPLLQAARSGQNPQVAGDIYATIRSDIGKTIRANGKNPDLQRALGSLQDALDGVVERSTSGPLRQEWADARREYQALMTVDKAMRGGSQLDRAAGNIPLGAFKNAVMQADPAGFARGRGQLNELSRVGDMIGTRVPDSGTATRNAIANPLMWPVMVGGNIASRVYNSAPAQAYLSNQIAGPTNLSALYGGIAAQQGVAQANGGDNSPGTMALAFRKALERKNALAR